LRAAVFGRRNATAAARSCVVSPGASRPAGPPWPSGAPGLSAGGAIGPPRTLSNLPVAQRDPVRPRSGY